MDYRVIWTTPARDDLRAIAEYIARDSRNYAVQFVTHVIEETERLASFPFQGRTIPEFGDSAQRELIIGTYRLFYTVRGHNVYIVTIVHGARLVDPGSRNGLTESGPENL